MLSSSILMLLTSPVAISFKIVCCHRGEARSARRPFQNFSSRPPLLLCEPAAGGMSAGKSKAQAFRMEVHRQDDKAFHRAMGEWWGSAAEAWGSRWRPHGPQLAGTAEGGENRWRVVFHPEHGRSGDAGKPLHEGQRWGGPTR